MKTKLKKISYWAGVSAVGIVLGLSLQFTRAWVEPTVAPPGGNIGAPINTGSAEQTKYGMFSTSAGNQLVAGGILYANQGIIVPSGNVGIGVPVATQKLDVNGNIRATDVCTTGGTCLSNVGGGAIASYNDLPRGAVAGHCRTFNNTVTDVVAPAVKHDTMEVCRCVSGWTSKSTGGVSSAFYYTCIKN